ncbi:hypothetical protein [Streptomyces sp. 3213.3]|uniref:hypothetical protein n=1 Tax=Streptomyces sp. 3213.3 TaxID=1855348 RepID=UPI003FA7E0CF
MRYTTCEDDSWVGDMYDYGHGEPTVTEAEEPVGASLLTVVLPASTRIRLTLRLSLRTRTPSYRTSFSANAPAGSGAGLTDGEAGD